MFLKATRYVHIRLSVQNVDVLIFLQLVLVRVFKFSFNCSSVVELSIVWGCDEQGWILILWGFVNIKGDFVSFGSYTCTFLCKR